MVVAGAIVLGYGFWGFLRCQRTEKRVRGGLTSRQGFGLDATMKRERSAQGQENVLQVPG